MLRIKRSVAATFNTQVNYMSAQMLAAVNPGGGQPSDAVTRMSALESSVVETNADNNMRTNQPKSAVMFVKSTTKAVEEIVDSLPKTANPDEIDINDDDEDEEEDADDGEDTGAKKSTGQ